ncbi:MAG: hypothetical protein AAF387_05965, partial [Pseudomonadota bacterium]
MDIEAIKNQALGLFETLQTWAQSPAFYAQLGCVIGAILAAVVVSRFCRRLFAPPQASEAEAKVQGWRHFLNQIGAILLPLLIVIFLGIAVKASDALVAQSWIVKIAQGLSVVWLIYKTITQFVRQPAVRQFTKWVIMPIAVLYVFGWLDNVIGQLDAIR